MPHFYFDTDDGERVFRDEEGVELRSRDDVPGETLSLLRDLAHHDCTDRRRIMGAVARDVTGAPVYRATLTIRGESLG